MRSPNSSLVFGRSHVESKYMLKQCRMLYEGFTTLCKFLYPYTKVADTLQIQDILIYTLKFLLSHPEVSTESKSRCCTLLMGEFQDPPLLQLRVISLLSDTVIAIGDIKQQIYALNGVYREIVGELRRYFPNTRELNPSKFFRCTDTTVDYNEVITHPNAMNEQDFIGTGKEGIVGVVPNLSLSAICDTIEQQCRENRNIFPRNTLSLLRNNYSTTPTAEELFKRKVSFRANKYQVTNMIPIVREICAVVELAANPQSLANLNALRYTLPERKDYREYTKPSIYKVYAQEGYSIFEAPYNLRDIMATRNVMELLLSVEDIFSKQRPTREILNTIFPLFNGVYLIEREPYLEMPSTYYLNMARSVVQNKTYYAPIRDEMARLQVIQNCNAYRHDMRCYTFHASKGLEADDVYILDADVRVIPNMYKLDVMEKVGCVTKEAQGIRNECSLLFVAATRAEETLVIIYTGTKTSMLTPMSEFEQYDKLYTQFRANYPDVEAFEQFHKGEL